MLTIIGVGHVFDIKAQVRGVIISRRPTIVGVELDRVRYMALTDGLSKKGVPLTYKLLASFQERMAGKYGATPGEEMLAAVNAAKELGAGVAFIDVNAGEVFQKFMASMSRKEKFKLSLGAFQSLFTRKKTVEREMEKYHRNQGAYMEEFSRQFPSIKKALVDDRDVHMAKRIEKLLETHGDVVAVVGDGHVEGLKTLLSGATPEIIRLDELRNMDPLAPAVMKATSKGTSDVTISFQYQE